MRLERGWKAAIRQDAPDQGLTRSAVDRTAGAAYLPHRTFCTDRKTKGKSLTVSEARDRLAEVIGQVQFGGERVTISKRGKPVVVSVEDAAWLEAMEDKIDIELAREAKAEMERLGGRTHKLEEVLAEIEEDEK
jgi:prevent-host-death family protein